MPSRTEDEEIVRSWGFENVFTWNDSPNAYYAPHTHLADASFLIRRGYMIVKYPDELPDPTGSGSIASLREKQKGEIENVGKQSENATNKANKQSGGIEGAGAANVNQAGKLQRGVFGKDNANGNIVRAGERINVKRGKVHEVLISPEGCEYVIGE